MAPRDGESFLRNFVSLELTVRNRLVDAGEVLHNDAAGAEIQMTDFGVAHLTIGKSDIGAARAEFAARVIAVKLIMKRRTREHGGVAVFLRLGLAAGIDPPTVANHKQNRTIHVMTVRRLRMTASSSGSVFAEATTWTFGHCDSSQAPLQKRGEMA